MCVTHRQSIEVPGPRDVTPVTGNRPHRPVECLARVVVYKYAAMALQATVLGASGYGGADLLRLLARHPAFEIAALGAERAAGRPVGEVHPHVAGIDFPPITPLASAAATAADVCFSALPSRVLGNLRDDVAAPMIIDLADDHRADPEWVYGLTEMSRGDLTGARRIANPGCYPTAVLLALVPFARERAIEGPVIVDALSGVSGAGKNVDESYLFASLHGSATAYGTTRHRHVPEMERGLSSFGGIDTGVSFTPHLVPMSRGLLATCRARWVGDSEPNEILSDTYAKEPFVQVGASWPSTKAVAGTNHASIYATLDADNNLLVVSCAIDNLGKGAAGQAIQNANVALDLDETLGLAGIAVWP